MKDHSISKSAEIWGAEELKNRIFDKLIKTINDSKRQSKIRHQKSYNKVVKIEKLIIKINYRNIKLRKEKGEKIYFDNDKKYIKNTNIDS